MNNDLARDPEPLYFEDYTPDLTLEGGTYHVSREEILEFGRRFDPQPLHTDEAAAAQGPFGGLIAPGCLTFAIRNALYNQLPVRPVLVAGLGLEQLDLAHPVRPKRTEGTRSDSASPSAPSAPVSSTEVSPRLDRGACVASA